MRRQPLTIAVLSFVCVLVVFSQAQTTKALRVAFSVVSVDDSTWPVHIVSLKHSATGTFSEVVLENATDKPVTAVRFEIAGAAPDGCSSESHRVIYSNSNSDVPEELQRVNGLHLRPVVIKPHEKASTITILLVPENLFGIAQKEKTPFLHVQLALEMVQFGDGAVWHAKRSAFNSELFTGDEARCGGASHAIDISNLQVARNVSEPMDARRFQPLSEGRGYMFDCELRDDLALCP